MGDTMKRGDSLHVGAQLQSANGKYRLVMQGDGNLVLYAPEGPVWDTGTWALPEPLRPTRLDFQTDGNLVLYNNFNYVGWSPNIYDRTDFRGGDHLVLQDDRNLVVYRPDNSPVWDTHTWIPAGAAPHEIVHQETEEVGWAKKMSTEAKLFRDGTLAVDTKAECGAWVSGLRGRVLVMAIDSQARVIWVSKELQCQTACSIFDPSCPSITKTHFDEKWPSLIGELAVRLDIFQADNVNYDQFRKSIRESLEFIKEIAPVLAAFVL
jgi:hypothetical protein